MLTNTALTKAYFIDSEKAFKYFLRGMGTVFRTIGVSMSAGQRVIAVQIPQDMDIRLPTSIIKLALLIKRH